LIRADDRSLGEAGGLEETKASIANKLTRATMSAHFFLASLTAIGAISLSVEMV